MTRGSAEFYVIKENFERALGFKPDQYKREDFENMPSSEFYPNGEVNTAFRWYLNGFSLAKKLYQE